MRPPTNNMKISITMDKDVHAKVEEQAIKENRTFSNFLETVLIKYLREHEND